MQGHIIFARFVLRTIVLVNTVEGVPYLVRGSKAILLQIHNNVSRNHFSPDTIGHLISPVRSKKDNVLRYQQWPSATFITDIPLKSILLHH